MISYDAALTADEQVPALIAAKPAIDAAIREMNKRQFLKPPREEDAKTAANANGNDNEATAPIRRSKRVPPIRIRNYNKKKAMTTTNEDESLLL